MAAGPPSKGCRHDDCAGRSCRAGYRRDRGYRPRGVQGAQGRARGRDRGGSAGRGCRCALRSLPQPRRDERGELEGSRRCGRGALWAARCAGAYRRHFHRGELRGHDAGGVPPPQCGQCRWRDPRYAGASAAAARGRQGEDERRERGQLLLGRRHQRRTVQRGLLHQQVRADRPHQVHGGRVCRARLQHPCQLGASGRRRYRDARQHHRPLCRDGRRAQPRGGDGGHQDDPPHRAHGPARGNGRRRGVPVL